MRLLILFSILFFSLSGFAQLRLELSTANQSNGFAFLDVVTLKEIISAGPEISTEDLAKKIADFFYSSPITVENMDRSLTSSTGSQISLRLHPSLQIDDPINEYFMLAYMEFFKKEQEIIVALTPKIIPYGSRPSSNDGQYRIKESFYHCIQSMALDPKTADCLSQWRPFLAKEENVLNSFISSYIRVYRASRFYFSNFKTISSRGLPGGLDVRVVGQQMNAFCEHVTKKYLDLEKRKAEMFTNRSMWNGPEQFYIYSTFPDLFDIAGSSFSFSVSSPGSRVSNAGLRFLCSIPQFTFQEMIFRN